MLSIPADTRSVLKVAFSLNEVMWEKAAHDKKCMTQVDQTTSNKAAGDR